MGFNLHGLAFKQSMMILTGVSIVFAILFAVISNQVESRLTALLTQKGEEISQANVALIEKLFDTGKYIGDELAVTLGKEQPSGKDLDDFLSEALFNARALLPQSLAIVVAYEPGMAPDNDTLHDVMRLARYSGSDIVLLDGGNYHEKIWYKSTKKAQKGIWQEPFIGDFIKEPIAIYTTPIYHKDAKGNRKFAGVLCVDMSIAFLKETIEAIPVSNSGYVVVLSANNMIIAHPKKNVLFKETLTDLAKDGNINAVTDFEKAVEKKGKGLFMGESPSGEEAAIYFAKMKSNFWTFMIVWPAQKYLESQHSMERMFLWLMLGGYVIMLVLVLVISTKVTKPLKELAGAANKLGHGDFDAAIPPVKGRDEVSQFAWAFSNMRTSLKEYLEKQKDMDRIERELEFAKFIQLGILPKNEEEEHSNDDRHELAPFILPAKEVGGDFYDFFKLDEDRLCIVIGDVSGKGVPAALFMTLSRIVLRSIMKSLKSITETFNNANYELARRNNVNVFVTVWMGIINLNTGHVEFASAGHNPPAIRHKDGSVEFTKCKPGLVMAAMEETKYKMQTFDLQPGDTLFLYTDGVTEATDKNEKMFENNRLIDALKNGGDLTPEDTCKYVKKQIDQFVGDAPQFDDITMLAVKYKGSAEPVWERYEKTIGVAENCLNELTSFVEDILTPMDGLMKKQLHNAWERYEKRVDIDPKNQDVLTIFVESVLAPMEGSIKAQMQINIAIDEIYSNIVKFSGATAMTLVVEVCKAQLIARLTFIDNGTAYNPLRQEDPDVTLSAEERKIGGLGIFIVKKTMDSVTYCRNGDKNELTITKALKNS